MSAWEYRTHPMDTEIWEKDIFCDRCEGGWCEGQNSWRADPTDQTLLLWWNVWSVWNFNSYTTFFIWFEFVRSHPIHVFSTCVGLTYRWHFYFIILFYLRFTFFVWYWEWCTSGVLYLGVDRNILLPVEYLLVFYGKQYTWNFPFLFILSQVNRQSKFCI